MMRNILTPQLHFISVQEISQVPNHTDGLMIATHLQLEKGRVTDWDGDMTGDLRVLPPASTGSHRSQSWAIGVQFIANRS